MGTAERGRRAREENSNCAKWEPQRKTSFNCQPVLVLCLFFCCLRPPSLPLCEWAEDGRQGSGEHLRPKGKGTTPERSKRQERWRQIRHKHTWPRRHDGSGETQAWPGRHGQWPGQQTPSFPLPDPAGATALPAMPAPLLPSCMASASLFLSPSPLHCPRGHRMAEGIDQQESQLFRGKDSEQQRILRPASLSAHRATREARGPPSIRLQGS